MTSPLLRWFATHPPLKSIADWVASVEIEIQMERGTSCAMDGYHATEPAITWPQPQGEHAEALAQWLGEPPRAWGKEAPPAPAPSDAQMAAELARLDSVLDQSARVARECEVRGTRNRVCELGTRGCLIVHDLTRKR